MFVLVRKVVSLYWNTDGLEHASIKSITHDWSSKDENWSVFKVVFDTGTYEKNKQTDYIALRLIASNPKLCESGIDLLVLEKGFYDDFYMTEEYSEDPEEFNTYHINLTNIQFKHLKTAIKYAIENNQKVIRYTSEELKNIILEMKDNDDKSFDNFKKFVEENSSKPKQTYGDIVKAFLQDHPNFFKD